MCFSDVSYKHGINSIIRVSAKIKVEIIFISEPVPYELCDFFLVGGEGGGGVRCVLIQPLYNVKGNTSRGFCCFRSILC